MTSRERLRMQSRVTQLPGVVIDTIEHVQESFVVEAVAP
jgi:hypothetical protein